MGNQRSGVGRSHRARADGEKRRVDRARANSGSSRSVSLHRASRPSGLPRHAGGLCALPVPRKTERVPDSPQLDWTRQCHQRRRPGAGFSRCPQEFDLQLDCALQWQSFARPMDQWKKSRTKATLLEIPRDSSKIICMDFGASRPELMPGARNAVATCLGVSSGEQVALIADEASRAVAASISDALDERKAHCTGLLLEDLGPRPMASAPVEV